MTISYDIAYMWNLKKKTKTNDLFQNRNRPTGIENKFMVTKGGKVVVGIN